MTRCAFKKPLFQHRQKLIMCPSCPRNGDFEVANGFVISFLFFIFMHHLKNEVGNYDMLCVYIVFVLQYERIYIIVNLE